PGDVAVEAAQDLRRWRALPLAYRRIGRIPFARTRDGDPAPARFRHPDGAGRMPGLSRRRSADREIAEAFDALGRAFEGRVWRTAGARLFRHRARRHLSASSPAFG